MALTSGQVVLHKYKVVRHLGSGAWGDVYLAEDLQLGRQVAIKHLKADWAGDEMILQRFLQEARVIAALKHPNVVVIYALEQDGLGHYIVEEYAERGTVGDLLVERDQLPIEQASDLAIAICRALEAVHVKGIIHRDIKPSNILLFESPDGDLVPKLCDFGIAHVPPAGDKHPLTSEGDMLGTFQYISPEQVQGEKVDERSDLYSLGTVLYEMLTGETVFTGSAWEVLQGHVSKEPCSPTLARPEIVPQLNDLIMQALSKDPAGRHQSAYDMRRALQQVIRRETEKRKRVESLYAQGMAHLQAGEWRDAARAFEEVIKRDAAYRDAPTRLREAREKEKLGGLYKEGMEYLQRQEWQGAIERFMEIVLLDVGYEGAVDRLEEARKQQNLEILYAQGVGFFSKEKWSAAAAKFREVLSLEPGYLGVAARLEEAERQQKLAILYEEAVAQFERRNWVAAVDSLTEITELEANYHNVQAILELAKTRQTVEELYSRGLECFEKEEWSGAIQAFQKTLEVDEHFQEAATRLEQARNQQELRGLYDRGLRLERVGEWEEAYRLFHQILTMVPGYKDVPDRLARTGRLKELAQLRDEADELWAAGQWQEAVDRLSQAVEFARRYEELDRHTRSELHARLKAARKSLKRQEAAYARGQELLESQDWPRAVEAFRRVLELNPNHQDAAAQLREAKEGSIRLAGSDDRSLTVARFNWLSNAAVAFIAGGLCTGLIYQLANGFFFSLDPPLRILALVFLMLIFVPLFFYAQWLLMAWRREKSGSEK